MEECHDQVNWTLTSNNRTMQELIAQMSKKQLTIEIHRLGADYPVKSDQKASKKAAIKLLRRRVTTVVNALAIFGDIWRYLAIFGDIWRYLAIFGDIWRYLAIFGDIWRYLAIFGDIW